MMLRLFKRIILLSCLSLASINSLAATLAVSPASTSYTIGTNPLVNTTWTITTGANDGGTYTSTSGTYISTPTLTNFTITLGTGGSTYSTRTLPSSSTPVFESFTIPASVISAAQQNNLTTIYYYRDFSLPTGGGSTGPAFFQINLTQPSSTGTTTTTTVPNTESVLDITRVALRFSDNSIVKLIKPDTRISAVADINYTGTGLLDARWEVADPSSTRATPFFIPLQTVRRFLGAGGQIYLQSPTLPSKADGNYIVRLRVRAIPATPSADTLPPPEQQVLLRYTVNPRGGAGGTRLPPINLRTPSANALLTDKTLFSWRSVKGARAYQLELYARPQNGTHLDEADLHKTMPASGILVPGRKTGIGLGALSRSHLQHGQSYYWRVMAIGPRGEILTTSLLREIRIP